MKKFIALLFFTASIFSQLSAQNLELKWSSKMTYDNSKDGFFNDFVGSSEDYVYGLYKNLAYRPKKQNKKIKLLSFDRKTMKKVDEIVLNSPKDKSRSSKLKGMLFNQVIVLKDELIVFWTKSTKDQVEIYAESFDLELGKKVKLKKVVAFKNPSTKQSSFGALSVVIKNSQSDETNVLIGCETGQTKNESIAFEYITIDSEFKETNKGKFDMDVIKISRSYGLTSEYQFTPDGKLYIKTNVSMSKEERKQAKKGEHTSYSILNIVDVETSETDLYTIKYDGMNVFNFNLVNEGDDIRLYGFFNDMEKDPSGNRTHGIFFTTIKGGEMTEPNYSYFDKSTLDELFKNDVEDKKTTRVSKKDKRKGKGAEAKKMDEEALDDHYQIELAKILDKDHIVLFCSKMYNYSVTTCTTNSSGGTSCTTRYYCSKGNVTAFNLNTKGDIVWASNVDRSITYSGTSIKDLRVVSDPNNFYVIYGSTMKADANSKSGKKSKKNAEIRDKFEYASFDKKSGNSSKKEVTVNSASVEKKDRKSVNPLSIQVYDNQYFINSSRITFKPLLTAAGCTASLVCFPMLYYVGLSGDFRKGTGYLGTIKITK